MNMRFKGIRIILAVLLCVCVSMIFSRLSAAPGPVKIAAIFPQTGIAAKANKPAIDGARLAVEEINSRGGLLEQPLEMIVIDNHSTPLGSKLAAELAVKLNASAVIGALWSSHSLAMARVLQKTKTPMISPSSTKPEVTLTGNYIFRAGITDTLQGQAIARFAYADLGAGTAVVLQNINEEYCMTLAEYFVKYFTRMGGKVPWQGNYTGSAVDFTDLLTEVKKFRPDIIFIPGYARDSGLIIKQAVKMGIRTTFIGGDGWGNQMYGYGGNAVEEAYYSTQWHPDVPFAVSRHMQELYRKKYGVNNNNQRVSLTYDSIMLFADAVRRAGSFDRTKIQDALAKTKDFQGASGTITFDRNGDPLNKKVIILKFKNGSSVFVKSISP